MGTAPPQERRPPNPSIRRPLTRQAAVTLDDTSRRGQESAGAELEALLRFSAARRVLEAIVTGEWLADDDVAAGAEELVRAGRHWLAVSVLVEAA
jgi:hypothetical protein